MSALNGKNGNRPGLLTKLFGRGIARPKRGDETSAMTSDGAVVVDIEKLIDDKDFQKSATAARNFLDKRIRQTELDK
jgi:hypothetical protein